MSPGSFEDCGQVQAGERMRRRASHVTALRCRSSAMRPEDDLLVVVCDQEAGFVDGVA